MACVDSCVVPRFASRSMCRSAVGCCLLAGLPALALAECPPPDNAFNFGGGGAGGRVFTAANVGAPFGGLVPFTGGHDLICDSQSLTVSTLATTTNGGTVPIQLQGSAWASGAQAHAAVVSGAGGGPLARNSTPAVFADAAAIVNFTVEPMPLSPAINAVLRIEATGDGSFGGSGSQGVASFVATLRTTGASPSFSTV